MSTTDNGVSPSNPITTLSPFSQGKQEDRERAQQVSLGYISMSECEILSS